MEVEASQEEEEDPVIAEVDVYLSLSLTDHLYLVQYPLRPAHLPYDPATILGARVNNEGGVAVDVGIRPRGSNYSTSRGEGYARMVQLGLKEQAGERHYQSGLWDKLTLASDQTRGDSSRYTAAVFKDGDLHLTPVQHVIQLKPSLTYLDQVDSGTKASRVGVALSDGGDTTESEGEDAVPVTVKFARQAAPGKTKSVQRKKSFLESESHDWSDVRYYGVESEEATEERGLLFANDDDNQSSFDLPSTMYLDLVCPMDMPTTTTGPITMPTGVLSLSQLKTLPLEQQVRKVHLNAHVIQFSQLCSLLGVTGQAASVLEAVKGCGVLVQGCWVVRSDLVYSRPEDSHKKNARDYILWCFTQKRLVPRKDVIVSVKLSHEELREMLQPFSNLRAAPHSGWEFKLTSDLEFINRHPAVVLEQEEWWTNRHKELVKELAVKSPGAAKHQEGKIIPGDQLVKTAHKKSKGLLTSASTAKKQLELSHAPTITQTEQPPSNVEADNKKEKDKTLPKPLPRDELISLLSEFSRESLGRGVLGINELKDKLLLKQSSVGADHPLRMCGVSDALLLSAIDMCGAMEVGQAVGKRLYALTHGDKVRSVILTLFQKKKFLKKKQIVDELTAQGGPCHDKIITACLRELCYSKGSQWRLLGTD